MLCILYKTSRVFIYQVVTYAEGCTFGAICTAHADYNQSSPLSRTLFRCALAILTNSSHILITTVLPITNPNLPNHPPPRRTMLRFEPNIHPNPLRALHPSLILSPLDDSLPLVLDMMFPYNHLFTRIHTAHLPIHTYVFWVHRP